MKIILTGATGLIGSRFIDLLHENHEIIPLSSTNGVDITDPESIEDFLKDKSFELVIHLAGKTDVDGCENDKNEDIKAINTEENSILNLNIKEMDSALWKNKKTAVAINSIGTKNIYEASRKRNAKFVNISTDFIFSGNEEYYDENSKPDPVDWYGMSKYLGEKMLDPSRDLNVRISFPYGYQSPVKKDLVWKIHDLLADREEVSLIADQVITPTFIDDIVFGLDFLIQKNILGLVNLVGSTFLSPKEIGEKIREQFNLRTVINDSKLSDVYSGKAPRPRKSMLRNDKLKNIGFTPKTFNEGLALIASK